MSNASSRVQAGAPLPLERLVALLPSDGENDSRWGARRQGERIPFTKPVAVRRLSTGDGNGHSGHPSTDLGRASVAPGVIEGWALNVCHGGIRIITDGLLVLDEHVEIQVTTSGSAYYGAARVRWVREEADGVVAGLAFTMRR